ncbi:hypothetical protein TRVL_09236 [Trypanosoma vivax]|nr:hypothetical protein TRVL_09236 [Trypanosoma vivax]
MPLIDGFGVDAPSTAHWVSLLCKLAMLWLPDEVIYCGWWPRVFILLVMLWCIGCVACAMMHSGRSCQPREICTGALLSVERVNTSPHFCCLLLSIAAIGTSLF